MITLNKILAKTYKSKGKIIPIDLKKLADTQHYSNSKDMCMEYGEMNFTHFIRCLRKQIKTFEKEEKEKEIVRNQKYREWEKWLDTCPIDWHSSRHPSSEIETINFEIPSSK
tara:strand:+ start:3161 stop:3496 length:336 start_codon:yes stop_codon:yes gene_type:complete